MDYLSGPRMATYERACGGDRERALTLYEANANISGRAFTSLHYFEVILRNAIDIQLRTWNQERCGEARWTRHAAHSF